MARSDRLSSMRSPLRPAPRYTWHAVVSHVLNSALRLSAQAYARAATACASSALMPAPPAASPQDAGDSRGTTPRRYCSMGSVLTTQVLAPEATRLRLPRYDRRLPVGPHVRSMS